MQNFPQKLQAGARVGICAPSGIFSPEGLQRSVDFLRSRGLECVMSPSLGETHRYLAGTDAQRLRDLEWGLRDPGLDALWVARGGYGINRLLPELSLEGLDDRPVVGFSDVTSLHVAMFQNAGKSGIHGPVLHSLTQHPSAESVAHVMDLLQGGCHFELAGASWRPGCVEAPVVGGNLCMLASLCGTPWQLQASGRILLLEEVGEAPYRVDRMIQQLQSSGCLDGVVGIALGSFTGFSAPEGQEWGLQELICEAVDVPVIGKLPIGHGRDNYAFVYGASATIDGDRLVFHAPAE